MTSSKLLHMLRLVWREATPTPPPPRLTGNCDCHACQRHTTKKGAA